MRIELLACVAAIALLVPIVATKAAGNTPNGLSNAADRLLEFHRSALNDERELLEKQADRQFAAIQDLYNRAIWVFGAILSLAALAFAWFLGRTRKDLVNNMRKQIETETRGIIDQEANGLRARYRDLKSQVDDLIAYKGQPVTWVFSNEKLTSESEIEALHTTGIQNIQTLAPGIGESLNLGEPDLVIFSFDGSEEARRRLGEIVERLKSEAPPVCLLIYTYSRDGKEIRLGVEERQILAGFDWYVPVNFPSQLLAQSQLLLRRNRELLRGSTNGQL